MSAGLLARNAVNKGLKVFPTVKTSLAPGSKVVTGYLKNSGLPVFILTSLVPILLDMVVPHVLEIQGNLRPEGCRSSC